VNKQDGESEIRIEADEESHRGHSSRCLGRFRPLTVEEAELALLNGLIDVQEYSRCLVAVEPLVDTLRDADAQIRKGATFELKRRADRHAVKLLEEALQDENEEVRLFAAEALEKLDSMYNEAINAVIELIKAGATRRQHFLLGRIYFEYAFKGMYDAGMQEIYYEKAIAEFVKALDISGEDPPEERLILFVGACAHELGRFDEALENFARVRSLVGDGADVLMRLCAVHFALHDYQRVGVLCRRVLDEYGDDEYGEVLRLWAS